MAFPRGLKPMFLALAAALTITTVTHGQSSGASQPAKVIPPSHNDRWMTDMAAAYPAYGQLKLNQVLLPGSHDSGTWTLDNKIGPGLGTDILKKLLAALQDLVKDWDTEQKATFERLVITSAEHAMENIPLPPFLAEPLRMWSKAQKGDITAQLEAGVRVLDLRPCAPKIGETAIRICHGLYGPTLESVLDQIAAFLTNHPERSKEILILGFGDFYGMDTTLKNTARDLIKQKLRPFLFKLSTDPGQTTLDTVWGGGTRIIALYPDSDIDTLISDKGLSQGAWPDEFIIEGSGGLLNVVKRNLECRCNSKALSPTSQPAKFFGLEIQATLSDSVFPEVVGKNAIAYYLDPNAPSLALAGLKHFADLTNPVLIPAVMDSLHANHNIVLGDWVEESSLVEAIKSLTLARLEGAAVRPGDAGSAPPAPVISPAPARAYLSRTDSVGFGPGAVTTLTTSWNGTYFGNTTPVQEGNDFMSAFRNPAALAHFGGRLFVGFGHVTSIADSFIKTGVTDWSNGTGFAVNTDGRTLPLPPGSELAASYATGYDAEGRERFYMAWADASSMLHIRWSADGKTFGPSDTRSLNAFGAEPVLATRLGELYIAWNDGGAPGFLHYARIQPDGSLLEFFPIPGVAGRPAMIGFGDYLVLAWRGQDFAIRVLRVDMVNNQVPLVVGLADKTAASPSLAVFKGSVVLAYTGMEDSVLNDNNFEDNARYTLVSADGFTFPPGDRTRHMVPISPGWSPVGPTLHAWGDRGTVRVTGMRKADSSPYVAGSATDQPVTVSFACEAPVAGVYGFIAGEDNQFVEGHTVEVTAFSQQVVTVKCVDLSGRIIEGSSPEILIAKTPPQIFLTGPTALAAGEIGEYLVQGYATQNDPVSLVSITCAGDPPASQGPNVIALPNPGLSINFTCKYPTGAGINSIAVTATIRDVDGVTTDTRLVINGTAPVAAGSGPVRSSVGKKEHYSFDVTRANGAVKSPSGSCGPHGTTLGVAKTGDLKFSILCQFTSPSPADPVTLTFTDNTDIQAQATVLVAIGEPPTGEIVGAIDVTTDNGGSFTVKGASTDGDDVSLVSVSCEGGQTIQTFGDRDPGTALFVKLSCSFPNGSSVTDPRIRAVLRDFDGDKEVIHALHVSDVTPPVVSVNGVATNPPPISIDSLDAGGVQVSFTATAVDNVDGPLSATCEPASGTTFAIGTTNVTCTATDKAGLTGSAPFTVTVRDKVKPVLSLPESLSTEAQGPNGVSLGFSATATDNLDGSLPVTCSPASPAQFAIDPTTPHTTTVACSATDGAGNTASGSFTVTVVDTTPPMLIVPADIAVPASGAHTVVTFTASASDLVDGAGVPVACSPASGSPFPVGTTHVSCSATDKHGNSPRAKTFDVTVTDGVAPVLTLPASTTKEAEGPAGVTLSFVTSATDNIDGDVPVVCTPASPAAFGIDATTPRTTTVDCSATDQNHNVRTGSFAVTVVDTTPPLVTVPSDMLVPAAGLNTVVTFSASASDLVDGAGVPVSCSPASGSPFPLGTTKVTCSSTDKHGNSRSVSFNVKIADNAPPVLSVANVVAEATGPAGAAVNYSATATDAIDPHPTVACVRSGTSMGTAPGDTFPIGTTAVTCTATDASGNAGTAGFTITVRDTATPGEMRASGWIKNAETTYDFDFRVRERASGIDKGHFTLRVTSPDQGRGKMKVDGRDDRFVARTIDFAVFSDDPTIRPGRAAKPQMDTVLFKGIGEWNRAGGYRYEVFGQDAGEPGRHRESVRITITDLSGRVVAQAEGVLNGGNLQSVRIHR